MATQLRWVLLTQNVQNVHNVYTWNSNELRAQYTKFLACVLQL